MMRARLNEMGWVDEVKSESKGSPSFFLRSGMCLLIVRAESSREDEFQDVLAQVSSHAQCTRFSL